MAKYVYPAIFAEEKEGGYSVTFPDLQGCHTQGEDIADAIEMAEDALCLMLFDMEERGIMIPPPSKIKTLVTKENENTSYVRCDTVFYRQYNSEAG